MTKTVLVVDDEFAIVDVLTALLSDDGFRVVTAANGQQGLARIAEGRPDVIVLDLMMPVMDGHAMLEALDADPALRDIPVILVSAVPSRATPLTEGREFLQKPFLFDKLVALIHKVTTTT